MDVKRYSDDLFVRLDPAEELIDVLARVSAKENVSSAAIVSGVGMIAECDLGFFDVAKDEYDRIEFRRGPYDLSVVSGNLTSREGKPAPHVHVVMNNASGQTFSGHVLRAVIHITCEIFIRRTDNLDLIRCKLDGIPATRIITK